MKKKLSIIILGTVFMLSGCLNKNNDGVYEEEVMETPEYNIAATDDNEVQSDSPDNIIDGYELIELSEKYKIYIPYVSESERVQGVSYCFDVYKYSDFMARRTYNIAYNKPDGASSIKLKNSGFGFEHAAQPEFSDFYDKEDVLNKLNYYTEAYNINTDKRNQVEEKEFYKCDIEAISIALYEEFYEERPSLDISIYGISTTKWENDFSKDNKFSSEQYSNYINKLEKEELASCEFMATKRIDETGVYYIDFSELEKKGDYQQFIIEFKFDKEMEYSFGLNDCGTYMIDNEEKYQKWKANKEKNFVN